MAYNPNRSPVARVEVTNWGGAVASTSDNLTTAPITATGGTFTGTWETNDLPEVMTSLQVDANAILYYDFSNDGGTNFNTFPVGGFNVSPGVHEFHTAVKGPRSFRARLVLASGETSTYCRLYTYFGSFRQPSSPLNQRVSQDRDATLIRPNNFYDEVVLGLRSEVTYFAKFGRRASLTAAAGEEMVWEATATTYTPLASASTMWVTYNSSIDGPGTSGATILQIIHVNGDGDATTTTHVLASGGTSQVSGVTTIGINRVAVAASPGTGNNGIIKVVCGPSVASGTTQAFIPAGDGVTQQCLYITPSKDRAIVKDIYINIGKPGGGNAKVVVKGIVYNRNVGNYYEVFRTQLDTSAGIYADYSPEVGFPLSQGDNLFFVADTDTSAALINLRFDLIEYRVDFT